MERRRVVRVAAAELGVTAVSSLDGFLTRSAERVSQAVGEGAEIICFAEYAMFELASLVPNRPAVEQLEAVQPWLPQCLALFDALAVENGVSIVSPGYIEITDRGAFKRALVSTPSGAGVQDKIHRTAWEKEFGLTGGSRLGVFDHNGVFFGVAICYDAEFPHQIRALVEAGIELLLVPSVTDSRAGFERVRLACRARALESQVAVVPAPLTGTSSFSEFVDTNVGVAGVFVPPDRGLPDDGVMATGTGAGWLITDIDLAAIADARHQGDVAVRQDWAEEFCPPPDENSFGCRVDPGIRRSYTGQQVLRHRAGVTEGDGT